MTEIQEIHWDIRPEGRSPSFDELLARREFFPEKAEIIDGQLDWSNEERIALLGTLLELLGTRAAVQLGDHDFWERAVRDLRRGSSIHRDPETLGGAPVFPGTRVPVGTLLDYLAAGRPLGEFLDDFPSVTPDQAAAVLEEARGALLSTTRSTE